MQRLDLAPDVVRHDPSTVLVLGEHAALTEAAHAAGFADSAHLTRTCKHLMGVRPAKMLPQIVYLAPRG